MADDPHRVPNTYFVFLHPGCTLQEHKWAIGNKSNLETAIAHIFPEQELDSGYIYRLDDNALAAVRGDIGVDMVKCDGRTYFTEDVAPPLPYHFYEQEMEEFSARLMEEQRALMQREEWEIATKDDLS